MIKEIALAILVILAATCIPTFGHAFVPGAETQDRVIKNMLTTVIPGNPGFENGTRPWALSGPAGATFTLSASVLNVGSGQWGAIFDSDAANQFLCTPFMDVPAGQFNRVGYAKIETKTAATDYLLQVIDTATGLLGSTTISASTYYTLTQVTGFTFGAAGDAVKLCVKSQSSAVALYLDDAYLGLPW